MQYRLVYQRRRSVGLRVMPDGELEVRAPHGCPRAFIDECVRKRGDWLQNSRAHQARVHAQLSEPPQTLQLMGRQIAATPYAGQSVVLSGDGSAVYVPIDQSLGSLMPDLAQFYREQARAYLAPRTEHWAGQLGLYPNRVSVTSAAKRWGSCSSKGSINYSWRLMMASPAAIDSVIIHELLHLKQLNHSPIFRQLERENTPQFEACKQELDQLAGKLQQGGWM